MRMTVTNVEIMGRVEMGASVNASARVTASDGYDNEVRWKVQVKNAPVVGAHVEVTLAMEERENERLAHKEAMEALERLVRLKDGERDEHYAEMKGYAWDKAREAVAKGGF